MKGKKTILVIGGTGFIGYHLLLKTTKLGWSSFSVAKKNPKKNRFIKKVKYLQLDITNFNNLKKLRNNYNYIVNLSDIHSRNSKKIINFFYKKKINKYIQIGSSAEYGNNIIPLNENLKCNPISKYGKNKFKITEDLLKFFKKYSFPVIILRLFQVYGPNDNKYKIIPFIIDNCTKNRKFNLTAGLQTRDFCYIDDVVKAIILMLKSKNKRVLGKIFNVGFGKSISIKELSEKIKTKINKGFPIYGKRKISRTDIIKSKASIKKIKRYINWSPKFSLERGIDNLLKK